MDNVEILVIARTNKVGSESSTTVEFDRDEWDAMDKIERDQAVFNEGIGELVEFNYEIVGG